MSPENALKIRYANLDDLAFIIDSQLKMALETENLKLNKITVTKGVESVFADSNKGFYVVAQTKDKKLIGCLMVTPEWSDWRNSWMYWIQSLYVVPEWRNKGIFRLLYAFVKQLVNERKLVSGIRLYVDKTNTRAQEVYRRVGMNGEHYATFEWMK